MFPSEFVGRGDMSRGGLLLRSAREGRELEYIPVAGAVRRGKRPPKLDLSASPVSPPTKVVDELVSAIAFRHMTVLTCMWLL